MVKRTARLTTGANYGLRDWLAQRVTAAVMAIYILSFQGPTGGLTFPMRGVSLHWFERLWQGGGIVDIGAAFRRSPSRLTSSGESNCCTGSPLRPHRLTPLRCISSTKLKSM